MIVVDRALRRVYFCRCRVHHGLVGFLLVVLGAYLVADDWHDWPWWPVPDRD
jgi:hypothetical protein